jgi:hypothetical protein
MFEPNDNEWENNNDTPNYWDNNEPVELRPSTSIADLRDNAIRLFEMYLAFRLKTKPNLADIDDRRRFLSEDETESIVKEFSSDAGLPDGVYGIGAKSVEELMQKTKAIMHTLMQRIMSNLMQEGVNLGLLDCAFDDEEGAFAFSPSKEGEKIIEKLKNSADTKKTKKRKKKKNDSED